MRFSYFFNMLGDFACVCHINKCLSRIYDACEIKEPTQLNSMYYMKKAGNTTDMLEAKNQSSARSHGSSLEYNATNIKYG
jgi:hypothetical protein